MPSLKASAVPLHEGRWREQDPRQQSPYTHGPDVHLPPSWPSHLMQSSVMISSLPSIVTNTDGLVRQFYKTSLPTRRLILSS